MVLEVVAVLSVVVGAVLSVVIGAVVSTSGVVVALLFVQTTLDLDCALLPFSFQ